MNQYDVKKITLNGDLSTVGVKEQFSLMLEHIDKMGEFDTSSLDRCFSHEINLSGVNALDACGCQLLAVFIRTLRKRGVKKFSLMLSDDCRKKVHSLGFDDELFNGEFA